MKHRIIIAVISMLTTIGVSGQSTYDDNNPNANSPTGYLGWDDTGNENLDIFQNNTLRTRFTSVNWTGLNGISANNVSRIRMGLNGLDSVTSPFSMIHMGEDINEMLYRDWMNVGITMGASNDIMHVGILPPLRVTLRGL